MCDLSGVCVCVDVFRLHVGDTYTELRLTASAIREIVSEVTYLRITQISEQAHIR